MQYTPVFDTDNRQLMPTKTQRAIRWVNSSKATPFYKKGVWCVRLNVEPSARNYQPIAVGIDPGSKREGITVKSKAHTYLNIQAYAVDWVKDAVETRRNMRRARRFRNTPCRQNKSNQRRAKERLLPSIKARWQWKLRLCTWLSKLFPVSNFVVEDIKARTLKKGRKWNLSFSPLQVGKSWFYKQLEQLRQVKTRTGIETKQLRDAWGLKKSKKKLADTFNAHCVDSWVLANSVTQGHTEPDNTNLMLVVPLRFHRRQLHRLEHAPGHIRPRYGGSLSCGFKRGSLVKHSKYGIAYIGGYMDSPTKKDPQRQVVSLHCLETGKRLTQRALIQELKFLSFNSWRWRFLPSA